MRPPKPPDFTAIASADRERAFLRGHPEVVEWLGPGTKLFKWTHSVIRRISLLPYLQPNAPFGAK